MSSTEKIKRKKRRSEIVAIGESRFCVTALGTLAKSELIAQARRDNQNFDCALLAAYVTDADTGERWSYEDWTEADEDISGPLFSIVFQVAGLDKDDLKRHPKDSSTIES